MDEMLDPRVVGVADRRHTVLPPDIVTQHLALPIAAVEGRIREDEVGAQVLVQVVAERVGVLAPEVRVDAADGQVHLAQLPRGWIRLLPEDRESRAPSAM